MRSLELIKKGSPCDTDFTDSTIQTITDACKKGKTICPNYQMCQQQPADCVRRQGLMMARYLATNRDSLDKAIEDEKSDWMREHLGGTFWSFRDEKWQIVEGRKNVIDEVVEFAMVVLDMQPGERRPFTKDGTKSQLGPNDALHNAMLDLDDIYAEVGQKNPFRGGE